MKRIAAMAVAAFFATTAAEAKSSLCVSQINEALTFSDIQRKIISDLSRCKEDDAIYIWASTKLDAETLDIMLQGTGAAGFCDFRHPISMSVTSDIRNGARRGYLRCVALGYQREERK